MQHPATRFWQDEVWAPEASLYNNCRYKANAEKLNVKELLAMVFLQYKEPAAVVPINQLCLLLCLILAGSSSPKHDPRRIIYGAKVV